jgi:hypothetical protein
MQDQARELIDAAVQKLQTQTHPSEKAITACMDHILKERQLVKKVSWLIRFVFYAYKMSNPAFCQFHGVVVAEEPSAPKDVNACIAWYPRFAAERRAIQKTQDESIKSFSDRLCAIQESLKELGLRLRTDQRSRAIEKAPRSQFEALKRELDELKATNHKYEMQIESHSDGTDALKAATKEREQNLMFEIETQKEKARIMRNDLNFVLRQKLELENVLSVEQDLLRQKNAECLSLRALLRDRDLAKRHEMDCH